VDDIYRIISNNPPAAHSKGFQVTVLRPLTNEWTVSALKYACVVVCAVWCCRYVCCMMTVSRMRRHAPDTRPDGSVYGATSILASAPALAPASSFQLFCILLRVIGENTTLIFCFLFLFSDDLEIVPELFHFSFSRGSRTLDFPVVNWTSDFFHWILYFYIEERLNQSDTRFDIPFLPSHDRSLITPPRETTPTHNDIGFFIYLWIKRELGGRYLS